MRNTGRTYLSTEQKPATTPAFADLLPPLPEEQYTALETDILQNGCYSPVIVNEDNIVIDGHHRHEICEKYDLPYQVAVFSFEDDLEAKQWALDTQKARRSLTAWELGQIALKLKPEIEAKAAANHAANGGDKKSSDAKSASVNSPKPISDGIDVRKELADLAGIGDQTMGRIIKIDERAPESIKKAMNDGMSINAGYNITRLLEKLPEEAREAAAQRAVELAKEKKNYRAAFDLSIGDMDALAATDKDAAADIRKALNSGEISVNGGKEVPKILLSMTPEMRAEACSDPEELAEIEDEYVQGIKKADEQGKIAKAYCAAFEKAVSVHGTEYEVRTWVEFAGILKSSYPSLIEEAEGVAERFAQVVEILKKIYETEVKPYEHLYQAPQDESGPQDQSGPQG